MMSSSPLAPAGVDVHRFDSDEKEKIDDVHWDELD